MERRQASWGVMKVNYRTKMWVAGWLTGILGWGAEPAIIAKARLFLGEEAALNRITSVHYEGSLVTAALRVGEPEVRSALDIVYQKPDRQRVMASSATIVEVTALDGYDGWQRIEDLKDVAKWRQTLLGREQIKRLRANTWENLAYFRGIERVGGKLEDQGGRPIDGIACRKIAFVHGPGITFFRYFEEATGRLVLTETEAGGTIREVGETRVGGVRFPKSIITTTQTVTGETQTVTLIFEKITVNEARDGAWFAIPRLAPR
ncbi:MAG: hypothetical protein RL077_6075 [Verrucomicrobiota bacterium]